MAQARPKVSICIPTFNRKPYLSQAIASVLNQTLADFELIICDDGSDDGTAEFLATQTDPRIRILRQQTTLGPSPTLRAGFAMAQGEYFMQLHDDDRLVPDCLERTVTILEAHPEIDWVSTGHWVIDAAGRRDLAVTEENAERWGRTRLNDGPLGDVLTETFVYQSLQLGASLFRRQVLVEADYLRADLRHCGDNELLVRLALAHKRAYFLSARLMEYRFHKSQTGLQRRLQYLKDKATYLDSFRFPQRSLEQLRRARLAQTWLSLGFRLVEQGDRPLGRQLIWQGRQDCWWKAIAGLGLSLLPQPWQRPLVERLRQRRQAQAIAFPFVQEMA